jgi:hypothetical protein
MLKVRHVICCAVTFLCSGVFSLNRFGDHALAGIELNVVNVTTAPVVVCKKTAGISLFCENNAIADSVTINANQTYNIELAFRNTATDDNDKVDVLIADTYVLRIDVKQKPSPSIKKDVFKYPDAGQHLVWELYSARKGGGAQYYLVLAKDQLGLSLSRPVDSKMQSYTLFSRGSL